MWKTFDEHWRDADLSSWRWPNSSPTEIACRGTGWLLTGEKAPAMRQVASILRNPCNFASLMIANGADARKSPRRPSVAGG